MHTKQNATYIFNLFCMILVSYTLQAHEPDKPDTIHTGQYGMNYQNKILSLYCNNCKIGIVPISVHTTPGQLGQVCMELIRQWPIETKDKWLLHTLRFNVKHQTRGKYKFVNELTKKDIQYLLKKRPNDFNQVCIYGQVDTENRSLDVDQLSHYDYTIRSYFSTIQIPVPVVRKHLRYTNLRYTNNPRYKNWGTGLRIELGPDTDPEEFMYGCKKAFKQIKILLDLDKATIKIGKANVLLTKLTKKHLERLYGSNTPICISGAGPDTYSKLCYIWTRASDPLSIRYGTKRWKATIRFGRDTTHEDFKRDLRHAIFRELTNEAKISFVIAEVDSSDPETPEFTIPLHELSDDQIQTLLVCNENGMIEYIP